MFNETFLNAAIKRASQLASIKKEASKTNRETRTYAISGELNVIQVSNIGKANGEEYVFNRYLPLVQAMTAESVNAFTVSNIHNNMQAKKHKAEFVTTVTMHTYGKEKNIGILFAYDNGTTDANGNWKAANFNTVVRKAATMSSKRAATYGFDIEASDAYFETIKKWFELFEHDFKTYDESRNLKWTKEVAFATASYQGVNESVSQAFAFAVFDVDSNGRKFIEREYIFMGDVILLINRKSAEKYTFIKDKKGNRISALMSRQTIKINSIEESKNVKLLSMIETDVDAAIAKRKSNGRIKQEIKREQEINPFTQAEIETANVEEITEEQVEVEEQKVIEPATVAEVIEAEEQPEETQKQEENEVSIFRKANPVSGSIFGKKPLTAKEEARTIIVTEQELVDDKDYHANFNMANPIVADVPAPINATFHFERERV
ncbi:hypothetical protein [Aeromonas sp. 604534]|uniref:hypothetical protein n=1 Tax=Aeromonas sp. 604534 TaxID=2712055 RepID=UPI003BA088F4